MGIKKRVLAAMMVGVLTLSSALTVSAATSSLTDGQTTQDPNVVDHLDGKTVTSDVNESTNTATVKDVKSEKDAEVKNAVVFNVARTDDGKQVPITQIGNGSKGVFDSSAGRIITRATVKSSADVVVIAKNAFKGSKVKTLKLNNKKTIIKKNAFNKTKAKSAKIYVNKGKISAKKGAFKGLNKKAKIVVPKGNKNYRSKKAFNKLKKSLKNAGFKGKITRK